MDFRRSDGSRTGYVGDGGGGNNVELVADAGNVNVLAGSGSCVLVLNGASWSCSSDRNLKKDIRPLEDSLRRVTALNGVSYRWKKPGADENRHLGVVAQDVEQVFPELVTRNSETGMLAVEYDGLIAPLIEAVKELKATNDKLAAENAALRADFEAFKKAHH